ncbi:MAG: tetratricopeptide repeat protein [Okeania sp. SIO2G4]|uniref:tetratricopeptide repeat protein n=1 Tax=unclassified Okeania TaxID=2634635 RepID=UPI0013B5FB60|nr:MULTISPECIES: tetratricopeptide repeat protein [unclassified Okeania]NEP05163.1 tetratricopeptide repeat protein [Okeania sp. SIO4D6]NEP39147.1 tetratricopeptide repeat protein [Okeania sp. SIO2H7]NEP74598.1 tetratricopeptide repeat protein [Okeania sp. SIO2G5]NEP95659.1 tetratricopeptide repeat protein [Okeania sp. SIO2F5]NEQ93457.1 tetratricopeptide repeat protein [Okeania sp. SIO2G4]
MEQEIYKQAVAKSRARDYEAAIQYFSRVIEINPNFAEAYYGRGLAKFDLGNNKEAIADYTQALAINPNYIDAYLARGIAKLAVKDISATIVDANQIITINNHYAPAYKLLGNAYRQQDNQADAIDNFKRGAELYLEQKDAINCRKCLDNIKQIQSVSTTAVKTENNLQKGDSKTFLAKILRKFEKGDRQGVIADLNWALQVDPEDYQAYCCRGIIRYKQGDNLGAISDFNQALQFNDRDVLAYQNRGAIRSKMGDFKGAIADFDAALKIEPNNSLIYVSRGNTYRDMGAYQEAMKDYEQALKINPNEAKAFYHRGIVYSRLEEMKKAIDDYQNAAKLFGDAEDWNNYKKTLDNLKKIQGTAPSQNQNINEDNQYKQLQQKLLKMVGGHWEMAERLIAKIREKYPGRDKIWYLEKVISDYQQ